MKSLVGLAMMAAVCFVLPTRVLILLSVLAVMLADSQILGREVLFLARFVPSGVLAFRTLILLGSRPGALSENRMIKAWAPFLALATLSIAYSIEPNLSAQRLASGFFVLIGFGIGIPLFFPRLADLETLAKQVVLVLVVGVLYSLYATPQSPAETFVRGRVSGVFNNPNTLGLLAMQASLILLYWWQTETHRLRRRLVGAALVGCVAAVLLSGSRASAVGLAVGLLVYVRVRGRIERRALQKLFQIVSLVVVAFIFADLFFPGFLGGLARLDTGDRFFLWKRAWLLAEDHPILGVGFAASDELFGQDALYLESIGIFIAGSHSSPMRLLVDLGFVGVALALAAFVATLLQAWRYVRFSSTPELGAALLGVTVAGLVNSLFEGWLFGFGSASTVPFWFFLAMLSYQADLAHARVRKQARRQQEDLLRRMRRPRAPAAGRRIVPPVPGETGAPG